MQQQSAALIKRPSPGITPALDSRRFGVACCEALGRLLGDWWQTAVVGSVEAPKANGRLVVHHTRRLPQRCIGYRQFRDGLRRARHGCIRPNNPTRGEEERRGNIDTSEMERKRNRRRNGQHNFFRHQLYRHQQRRCHREAVLVAALFFDSQSSPGFSVVAPLLERQLSSFLG